MSDLADKIRSLDANIAKIKQGIEDFELLAQKKDFLQGRSEAYAVAAYPYPR